MRSKLSVAPIVLVVLGGSSTFLTACNTVEGAGTHAGHEVSEEAKEHK